MKKAVGGVVEQYEVIFDNHTVVAVVVVVVVVVAVAAVVIQKYLEKSKESFMCY